MVLAFSIATAPPHMKIGILNCINKDIKRSTTTLAILTAVEGTYMKKQKKAFLEHQRSKRQAYIVGIGECGRP